MRQSLRVILISTLPSLLSAQTTAPRAPTLQEYSVDAGHSIVEFSIGFAIRRIKGRFTHFKGAIVYDSIAPANSSVTIVIESKSIDTGWPHRDEHLRTSDFFDVEKYPTIVFQSDRLTQTNNGWVATGKLSMKGITKNIAIPIRLQRPPARNSESRWMMLNAEGSLRLARADFGILGGDKFNSWFDKARAATMSDSVDISLELEAWREDAESLRTPVIEAAIQRVRASGVQSQIEWLDSLKKSRAPAQHAGLRAGGDLFTRALIAHGRIDDAVKLSRGVTEMFPESARLQIVHGLALAMSGDNRGAVQAYAKAKQIHRPPQVDPNEKFPQVDPDWYYLDLLARTLVEWGQAPRAVALARTIVEMYPQFASAHTTLGLTLAAAGDARAAALAYAKAIEVDPMETRALELSRRLQRGTTAITR